MPLVCPQCNQVYDQKNVCPLCDVVLLYHAQALQTDTASDTLDNGLPQWQQTPWGKILIGLILAQGLSQGLRHLLTAGFLAGWDASDVWGTLWGLVLLHAVQAFSLLIGGALTGAGQSRGIVYGAFVGLANGILTLMLSDRLKDASTSVVVLAEPLIHLATGALGGGIGMLIWRPAPRIPELVGTSVTSVPVSNILPDFSHLFVGRLHMGRICAGAFVVVMGVVWSKAILEFLLRASQGTLTVSTHLQAQLVSMEISALVALVGAAFAGATTTNGLKQGLCVGMGASVIVLGLQLSNPKVVFEAVIFTLSGILILGLVGGWFGSQLFPPILRRKRHRMSYYS